MYSEEVFTQITQIQEELDCTLGEAVVEYANRADEEVGDVIKTLDPVAVAQIRSSLASSVLLKPSMRKKPMPSLFDDDC